MDAEKCTNGDLDQLLSSLTIPAKVQRNVCVSLECYCSSLIYKSLSKSIFIHFTQLFFVLFIVEIISQLKWKYKTSSNRSIFACECLYDFIVNYQSSYSGCGGQSWLGKHRLSTPMQQNDEKREDDITSSILTFRTFNIHHQQFFFKWWRRNYLCVVLE